MIILRSIFRVAEYVQGSEGELLKHEAYLFAFDATLMWILMVVMNFVHPGEISDALMTHSKSGGVLGLEMQLEEARLTRTGYDSPQDEVSTSRGGPAGSTIYARHGVV